MFSNILKRKNGGQVNFLNVANPLQDPDKSDSA